MTRNGGPQRRRARPVLRTGLALALLSVIGLVIRFQPLEAGLAPLAPPTSPQIQEVWRLHRDGVYVWPKAYHIGLNGGNLRVEIRIRLEPEEGLSPEEILDAQTRWEQEIHAVWSNRYALVCPSEGAHDCPTRPVLLDIHWVQANAHHTARVVSGRGRCSKVLWRTIGSEGDVAHEVGHFMGNEDEYRDWLAPGRVIDEEHSIMGNTVTGVAQPRHFQALADWLSEGTGCQYEVTALP